MSRFGYRAGILAATVAVMLGACSSSASPAPTGAVTAAPSDAVSSAAAPSPTAGEPVTLVLVPNVTPNLTVDFWNREIQRFEAANANIKVTLSIPPNTDTPTYVQTLVASGSAPDVATLIGAYPQFWPLLKPFDLTDPDLKQLGPNAASAYVGGQLYILGPVTEARSTIFFNKDMFTKAGVTAPTAGHAWTYDEFAAASDKLLAAGIQPMIATAGGDASWHGSDILSAFSDTLKTNSHWYVDYEAGKVKFTDADWVEGAQRVKDYTNKGYFGKGSLGLAYAQGEQDFLAGKAAMYQMGTWFSAAAVKGNPGFEVGVMAPPSGDGTAVLNGATGWGGWSVFQSTQHPAEAVALAKFLAFDPTSLKDFLDTDGQFSTFQLTSGPLDRNFAPLQEQIQEMLNTVPFYPSPIGQGEDSPRAGVVSPVLNQVGLAMLGGQADPAAELAKVDAAWAAAPPNPTAPPAP